MICKVLKRILSGGLGLNNKSSKGNHGKTSVFKFLGLEFLEVTLGETQGVKDTTGVSGLGVGNRVVSEDRVVVDRSVVADILPAADLNKVHEEELPSEETTIVHGVSASEVKVGEVLG